MIGLGLIKNCARFARVEKLDQRAARGGWFTFRRTWSIGHKDPTHIESLGETAVDAQNYLISEEGEFVKVVGDQYEYTGMYVVQ